MSFSEREQYHQSQAESLEALHLRTDLRLLFVSQEKEVITLEDTLDPTRPVERFLGGRMQPGQSSYFANIDSGEPIHFENIDIASWSFSGGYENVTISADNEQYLINGYGMTRAESPSERLDEESIAKLRSWLIPNAVLWSKSLSRRLVNKQLDLYDILNRKV